MCRIDVLPVPDSVTCQGSHVFRRHAHALRRNAAVADKVMSTSTLNDPPDSISALDNPVTLAGILYLNGSVLSILNTDETTSDRSAAFLLSLLQRAVTGETATNLGTALHLTRYPVPDTPPPATPVGKSKPKTGNKTGKQDVGDGELVEPMVVKMPDSLDPGVFNMVAWGNPHLVLGDTAVPAGKK